MSEGARVVPEGGARAVSAYRRLSPVVPRHALRQSIESRAVSRSIATAISDSTTHAAT